MILRLLAWLADLVQRAPGRVVAVIAVPTLVWSAIGLGVPTDLTFAGTLDRNEPLVAAYFEQSERLNLGGLLPLLLEGPDDEFPSGENRLDAAARAVAKRLAPLESVRQVDAELPTEWLKRNSPYLIDPQGFQAWLGIATHPEDSEGPKKLQTYLQTAQAEAERLRPEGKRVVMVSLSTDPLNFDAGGGFFFEIDDATQEALAPFGVTGIYAGFAAAGAQDQKATLGRVQLLTPISLLLVLLLFSLVEPNLLRLAIVAIPMMLAVGATLGISGTLLGSITILESFFGILVFGLGIDFALHLMVRMREERSAGASFSAALHTTLTGAGRGIVAGALTTAAAFAVVGLAPDPVAYHLGVSGAVGLTLCLVLMLTLVPAAWVLVQRRAERLHAEQAEAPVAPPRKVRLPFVAALSRHAARHPALHLGGAALFLVVAAAGMPRFAFETDLTKVFNRDVPALGAIERLQAIFGINGAPWVTSSTDLEEARRLTEALEGLDAISRAESVTRLIPVDGAERQRAVRAAAKDINAAKVTYEALIPLSGEKEAEQLKGVVELLDILQALEQVAPPAPETLPPSLRTRLMGPGGEFLIFAYVREPSVDGHLARKERLAVQSVAPKASGFPVLIEVMMAGDRPWALPILFAVLALVLFVLSIDLRQPKMVLLALTPVVLGTVGTFGILCWLDRPFSILSSLVVPLILGLGVDDGIHVVHRLKEDRKTAPAHAATQVGQAIVMTTATTCTSFAALMFTNHPGMEGMALIMLIGLPICLIASITTLPALAVALKVNAPVAADTPPHA